MTPVFNAAARPYLRRHQRNPHWRPERRRQTDEGLAGILSAIPSLSRPMLCRLTARMIDRLDDMDGDPDLEAEPDREEERHV